MTSRISFNIFLYIKLRCDSPSQRKVRPYKLFDKAAKPLIMLTNKILILPETLFNILFCHILPDKVFLLDVVTFYAHKKRHIPKNFIINFYYTSKTFSCMAFLKMKRTQSVLLKFKIFMRTHKILSDTKDRQNRQIQQIGSLLLKMFILVKAVRIQRRDI